MSIVDEFAAAVVGMNHVRADEDFLLPVALARACVAVLPVHGASLSLLDDMVRMPLGGSDEAASAAERIQFTHGDGPCLEVYRLQRPTQASSEEIQERWPVFFTAFVADTPYRSVASVPLLGTGRAFGALDLYSRDETGMGVGVIDDAVRIAARIVMFMAALLRPLLRPVLEDDQIGDVPPRLLQSPAARRRSRAWLAIGMVRESNDLNAVDALDLIRGYAWSHDLTLDTVADRLVDRQLTTMQMLQGE